MKIERIIEEMAKLDGYEWDDVHKCWIIGDGWCDELPNYHLDLNATQRVYKTLTKRQKRAVVLELRRLDAMYDISPDEVGLILGKPASDWCKAILKAVGKWEESE